MYTAENIPYLVLLILLDVPVNVILLAALVPTTVATVLLSVIILVTVCALVLWKKKRNGKLLLKLMPMHIL